VGGDAAQVLLCGIESEGPRNFLKPNGLRKFRVQISGLKKTTFHMKTISSLEKPVYEINLTEVVKEVKPNWTVDISPTQIKLGTPDGVFEVKHKDYLIRGALWVVGLLVLPLGVVLEANLPIGHPGLSFFLTLTVVGGIGAYLRQMLENSFTDRVEIQIAERAIGSAVTDDEMMANAVVSFWAIRDSAPSLAKKFELIYPDNGANSVGLMMLEPIRQAMRDLGRKIGETSDSDNKKGGAWWVKQDLYSQKLARAAKHIRDIKEGKTVSKRGFETAWFRTVKIPGWLSRAAFSFGLTFTIVLIVVIAF
jgi:hypothetical protein